MHRRPITAGTLEMIPPQTCSARGAQPVPSMVTRGLHRANTCLRCTADDSADGGRAKPGQEKRRTQGARSGSRRGGWAAFTVKTVQQSASLSPPHHCPLSGSCAGKNSPEASAQAMPAPSTPPSCDLQTGRRCLRAPFPVCHGAKGRQDMSSAENTSVYRQRKKRAKPLLPKSTGVTMRSNFTSATKMSEYNIWRQMIERCHNAKKPAYVNYGERGISVCTEWRSSFLAFLGDMGLRPSTSHSIDRINNEGNYEPFNCRWAYQYEQMRNTRSNRFATIDNETKTITELAEINKVRPNNVKGRLRIGWTIEMALTTPSVNGCGSHRKKSVQMVNCQCGAPTGWVAGSRAETIRCKSGHIFIAEISTEQYERAWSAIGAIIQYHKWNTEHQRTDNHKFVPAKDCEPCNRSGR